MTEGRRVTDRHVRMTPLGTFEIFDPNPEPEPEPVRVTLEDLYPDLPPSPERYLVIAPDVIPQHFKSRAEGLVARAAGILGVPVPQIRYFAEAVGPGEVFYSQPILGRVALDDLSTVWINVATPDLSQTAFHEVSHTAGYDEERAQRFAVAARLARVDEQATTTTQPPAASAPRPPARRRARSPAADV